MVKKITGTKEWAHHELNIQSGCSHNCKYCYAMSNAIRFKRKTRENWKEEEFGEIKSVGKRKGVTMFPTSHDITPNNLERCYEQILKLVEKGNKVLIVSKPHLECIKHICEMLKGYARGYEKQILFRFTIGSVHDDILKYWEPCAPSFQERKDSLHYAHGMGFETSVSCEPLLDFSPYDLIHRLEPYVTDAIWIGKMNQVRQRLSINVGIDEEMEERLGQYLVYHGDGYVKKWYESFKDNPKVKWKESLKSVLGLKMAKKKGMDI